MQCPQCDGTLVRSRRRGPERFIFSHTFRCKDCSYRMRESHLETGLFGEFASCPRCGNMNPDRRRKIDKVDSLLYSPIRLIHWMLGGKLYHCVFCRLQFYDFRQLRPKTNVQRSVAETTARAETDATATQSDPHKAKMAS